MTSLQVVLISLPGVDQSLGFSRPTTRTKAIVLLKLEVMEEDTVQGTVPQRAVSGPDMAVAAISNLKTTPTTRLTIKANTPSKQLIIDTLITCLFRFLTSS